MPVKDVTPTPDDMERTAYAIDALATDIHDRWPLWIEMAKPHIGQWSSPYMVVAGQLLGQGVMAMLAAQVHPAEIMKIADHLFDIYTDPEVATKLAALRDDKADILGFVEKLLVAQAEQLAKHRTAN